MKKQKFHKTIETNDTEKKNEIWQNICAVLASDPKWNPPADGGKKTKKEQPENVLCTVCCDTQMRSTSESDFR